MLSVVVSEVYKKHLYLLESEKVNDFDKDIFKRVIEGKASVKDIKNSLVFLTHVMREHYGRQVILLIDEYDVPVAKANSYGYYNEMLDVVFEVKYAKELEDMEADCQAALRQINERMCAKEYEDDYDEIFCYGISLFKKRCLVERK